MGFRAKFKRKIAQKLNDIMGDNWSNRNAKLAEDMGAGRNDGWSRGNTGLIDEQVAMRNEQEAQQALWDQQRGQQEAAAATQEQRLRDRMFQGNRKVGRGRASLRIDR